MHLLKKSTVKLPKVSLILLDWNVRDSFHICHYLTKQTIPRTQFEVITVEYYSKITSAVETFQNEIDTLVLLEMDDNAYYHKHLMYNIGFLLSRGEIIVICDSDAMVKPTFIQTIIEFFQTNPNTVLHLDEFRNQRRDLYPFQYPSFEEVTGYGCLNHSNGVTTGVLEQTDRLHKRNYGACFACLKEDYIAIEGSDEHVDFIGHICGPYDLTFRLTNLGKMEHWHEREFLYHTWHPGTDGIGEYLGPHDGYNLSTTSLEAIWSKRIEPNVPNSLILKLKEGQEVSEEEILKEGISRELLQITHLPFLRSKREVKKYAKKTYRSAPLKKSPLRFKTWKKWRFISVILLQKVYAFFMGKLPIYWKMGNHLFKRAQNQFETFSRATSYHLFWWETICQLHSQKKTQYIIVNTPRDLSIFSEFIRWRSKLSLKSRHTIELLFLGNLDGQKIEELREKGQEGNLYVTQMASYDWKKSKQLKQLKISLI